MNWMTRFFMACLVVLAATLGYGALRFVGIILQGGVSNALPSVALFNDNGGLDLRSSGFGVGLNTTAQQHMVATSIVPMTPPPFDENEENETDGFGHIRGVVTAVNGNLVTINGQTYTLVPRHSDVMGYFQVGSDVRLEYSVNPDGSLTIEELKVLKGNPNSSSYGTPSPNNNYYYYYNDDDDDGD